MSEDSSKFCNLLDDWADKRIASDRRQDYGEPRFENAWREVRLQISKSCLLKRQIYLGEGISKTPCPVHKGYWSGIHCGWPGQEWVDMRTQARTPMAEDPMLREWYDQGCRCYMHKCGCTTGWQPDEHCGCGAKP